jgi:uncharacterized membrane protein
MKPLLILLITWIISLLLIKYISGAWDMGLSGRIAMCAMLLFTAIGHFAYTKGMVAMVPDLVPLKVELVYATAIMEILLAFGLLFPKYQLAVGWILVCFFILVLPANIKAAVEHINYQTGELDGQGLSYLWFRIPLQLVFILWVYFFAIKK